MTDSDIKEAEGFANDLGRHGEPGDARDRILALVGEVRRLRSIVRKNEESFELLGQVHGGSLTEGDSAFIVTRIREMAGIVRDLAEMVPDGTAARCPTCEAFDGNEHGSGCLVERALAWAKDNPR